LKKKSIFFLLAILLVAAVYILISSVSVIYSIVRPEKGYEKIASFFKNGESIDINSKIVFYVDSGSESETGIPLKLDIFCESKGKRFKGVLLSENGLFPEISFEYSSENFFLEIPGIMSENIPIHERFNSVRSTDGQISQSAIFSYLKSLAQAGSAKGEITSSNLLTEKPGKRDRREWVYSLQANAPVEDIVKELFGNLNYENIETPDDNLTGLIKSEMARIGETNVYLTVITTLNMEPKLFEIAFIGSDGKKIMVISGTVNIS
jgi:hypothetical protein